MGNPYQGRHAPTGLAENFTWAVARVVMAEMPDDGLTCAWGLAMRISPWWRWNRLPSSRPESSASAGPPSDRAGGGRLLFRRFQSMLPARAGPRAGSVVRCGAAASLVTGTAAAETRRSLSAT